MTVAPKRSSRFVVVALCSAAIIVDGYDLIVYGTVVPTLVDGSAEWTLSTAEAGRIGAYALIGMLIGAIGIGTITDLVGRRRIMIGCVAWFSAAMALAALAPNPELFGVARFIAGLGLGGVVPTAIALTMEYAHPRHRSMTNAVMFCGYSIGGICVSLVATVVIPNFGWRAMFWIGAVVGGLLLPLCIRLLPESANYLLAKGDRAKANQLAERYNLTLEEPRTGDSTRLSGLAGLRALFSTRLLRGTLLFWFGTGFGLLLVYGLNTWLAQIMIEAGYGLGSALAFVLVLNLGTIIGTPALGALADRIGSKPVTTGMFLTAAGCIFLLSIELPTAVQYLLVGIAGACTIGTTILVNAYTGNYYSAEMRATGLGWALGIGRLGAILGPLYGSFILSSGWGLEANFYAFAVPAVLGALCMLGIPAIHAGAPARKAAAP
ncbi:AAHS family benzoate transporter-like MFS transporter [Tamaricihabitans halophyticus]|uniref:AAHS family benzoate transporter-like MFS transporter n=1 Tax=Tamaricihabitans halophyticus TaxID=1262583 RepID=A0A4R2QAF1_9PSEU|nr:aromatic acid/H+ symport family MFS transporter [Tamaricihabitans halophyticus]TCP43861.1 AAHS family benzoate transporter-like MFS transporter [Tamaricihabitans halophyticus]